MSFSSLKLPKLRALKFVNFPIFDSTRTRTKFPPRCLRIHQSKNSRCVAMQWQRKKKKKKEISENERIQRTPIWKEERKETRWMHYATINLGRWREIRSETGARGYRVNLFRDLFRISETSTRKRLTSGSAVEGRSASCSASTIIGKLSVARRERERERERVTFR